ncbi:hypothetical protein I0D00_17545 [Pseudomonas lalucatii]|uniref:Luciferase-like domain-containing protein n=1 Tax=Pseudomonas lalucatii TaxID=1424203 RepID=A0ABS5Q597_9PSED|nr:hypothetical protein [Pseudomonas lalucatii]MBS7663733.1 hypothetical protein [Pseudomonas lalucatii]MBS7689701.1 hypothetical protein [Pseudomonas lalucatii]MBS7725186.1 hypothetical protein [Pseudomonas lalucatii]QVM86853.1 hypothetical protein I0D68_14470 [Pseudomonas lalucatii]
MPGAIDASAFRPINRGYDRVFRPGRLSLGLVLPLERYASGPVPTLTQHLERVQLAEALGFSAVWLRDVPFNVPSFGDAGQVFDPFVYLGLRLGMDHLRDYLEALEEIGVNHVALNLRFNRADLPSTLRRLAEALLPDFAA